MQTSTDSLGREREREILASDDLWVLTRLVDGSDPVWDYCTTLMGTEQTIRRMFDLSKGVPFGWRLLKGKQARRWLRDSMKEEAHYQRDKKAREKVGAN